MKKDKSEKVKNFCCHIYVSRIISVDDMTIVMMRMAVVVVIMMVMMVAVGVVVVVVIITSFATPLK